MAPLQQRVRPQLKRPKPWAVLVGLFVVVLGATALFLVVPTPARAQFFEVRTYPQSSTLQRGTRERITYDFPSSGVKITMPRFLRNPRSFKTAGGDVLVMLRTPEDTCGLYQISETIAPHDAGPPPHFHYDTAEWFLPTEDSTFRIYGTQEAKPLTPGLLPGVNAPVPKMGSITIGKGEVAYSPKGTVHFWYNESTSQQDIRGFYNIWTPANGVTDWFAGVNNVNGSTIQLPLPGPQATTLQTALWGVPHDPTGSFVGRTDYRNIRGPVASDGNHLAELQNLFDRGELCYPRNGIGQSPWQPAARVH
jgi:hypothetical protein